MTRLKEVLARAARSEATIMLIGDSGTGKEYIAKHIHFNSRRRSGPFEVISCTNTQPELVESELFGHVAGSFTGAIGDKAGLFEIADGGTVLLDEIGDLPLDLQGKLLRVLQEGTYRRIGDTTTRRINVRVVTATNRNLKKMIREGTFRQDLFFRLDQIAIHIPPLRERREDILLLTDHFVQKYSEIEGRDVKGLSEDAIALLWRRDWPGNVRELEYFIYKLIIFTDKPVVQGEDVRRVATMFEVDLKDKIPTKLEEEELRHEIAMALNATRTEERLFKARATRYLGWDKNTLAQKMKNLGIPG
jgi:transcriptional regulator with PAS, ATPase and Fis domain